MVAKGFPVSIFKNAKNYPGHLTLFLIFICAVASIGNLILGYDLGISSDISLPGGARLRLSINRTDEQHEPPDLHAQHQFHHSHPQLSGAKFSVAHPEPHPPRRLLRQPVDASIPAEVSSAAALQKAEPVVSSDDHRRKPAGKRHQPQNVKYAALGHRVAQSTAVLNGAGGHYLRGGSAPPGHLRLCNGMRGGGEGKGEASEHQLQRGRGVKVRRAGGGERRAKVGVDMHLCERLCMVFSQETTKDGDGADERLCERLCTMVGRIR